MLEIIEQQICLDIPIESLSKSHLRDGVPEDEGGVPPCLGHVNLPVLCRVVLIEGNLNSNFISCFFVLSYNSLFFSF